MRCSPQVRCNGGVASGWHGTRAGAGVEGFEPSRGHASLRMARKMLRMMKNMKMTKLGWKGGRVKVRARVRVRVRVMKNMKMTKLGWKGERVKVRARVRVRVRVKVGVGVGVRVRVRLRVRVRV